jgi:hypothetical protein
MQESLAEIVRHKYDGKPHEQLSLGEIVRLKYDGYEVEIADLAKKLNDGKLKGLPLMAIIKKRAAYQRYLSNRDQRKAQVNGNTVPNLQYPTFGVPKIKS